MCCPVTSYNCGTRCHSVVLIGCFQIEPVYDCAAGSFGVRGHSSGQHHLVPGEHKILHLVQNVIGLSGSGDAGYGNSPDAINRLCDAEDLHVLCQAHPVPSAQSFSYRPKERSHFLTDRLARLATPAGLSLA